MADRPRKRMGRPPKAESEAVLTAFFRFLMTPDMKQWVLDHGGAAYIRRLVEEDQRKAEAAAMEDRG